MEVGFNGLRYNIRLHAIGALYNFCCLYKILIFVTEGKRRPLTPETNHQNLAEGIFDPATITWSEFLKVGVKTAPKSAAVSSQVQRAKSAKWTEQVTKIQSEYEYITTFITVQFYSCFHI